MHESIIHKNTVNDFFKKGENLSFKDDKIQDKNLSTHLQLELSLFITAELVIKSTLSLRAFVTAPITFSKEENSSKYSQNGIIMTDV
jgi:hypothetical protein